ncbi:sensor histidine kinase [Chitinophaga sancti]|uniref:histidine kinase n=1 Tax=Chitinophaga sancti TaxID=1004 RepID=A0A1K1R225_9BACT|nr:HAMP domain-containing sensor histidine kinase [Chitinophaga sancti]WQD64370.1 HAMP domain-containing sensor histidine kinase [Chitinophaga sancti]WQG90006.1 HAMP domain-containing sensor histidine kinase [Chitinophaga sancti]SFW65988.1 Signal transduction histidine kinase [Chitinophaga sancti]
MNNVQTNYKRIVVSNIIHFFNRLLNTGVHEANGIARNRQIRTVNIAGLTGGLASLMFSLINTCLGNYLLVLINITTMACLFSMVYFNEKKKYDLGPMITMPLCAMELSASALIYNNNMELYLLLVVCLSLILLNNKWVMLILGIFSAILLGVTHRLAPHTVIHQVSEGRRIMNAVIWLIMLLFCLYYFRLQIMGYTKELEESNRQLNVANKTREKLISILAHDMSSPINTLFFMLDLLQEDMLSGKDFAESSRLLILQARNLQENMDGLLQWCYTQMKGIAPQPANFNLVALIGEVITFLQPQFQKKHIRLQNDIAQYTCIINADPDHVRLIIRNLLSNAIKFSYQEAIIVLSMEDKGSEVIISVTDFGVGIRAAILESIFAADKIHSTPGTGNEKGIGLGLSLSEEFAQKNNGFLSVASEEGKGSTFSLHLHK